MSANGVIVIIVHASAVGGFCKHSDKRGNCIRRAIYTFATVLARFRDFQWFDEIRSKPSDAELSYEGKC